MNINIKVNKVTRSAIPDKNKIGVEGENLQENLVFYFEDEFVDGIARLEYEQDGVKNYIPLTKIDETYVVPIKNVITKPWKLNLELVITEPQQTEGIPLFKSEIFEVYITNAINAVNEAPEGYDLWIDVANAKIIEIDEKLEDVDNAIEHINDAIQETENLDLDVSDKVDGDVTVTLTKKDASTKTVELSDGTSLMFNWDGTRLGIKTDKDEEYTYVDLQGIQGPIGPQGEAFQIKKTYSSIAEMNADFDNMQLGDYVMIASTVETEDNAKLYTRGAEQWIFISDFSGATGIQGPTGLTPNIQIGTVVSGTNPSVTRTGTNENPILNFTLVKGETGNTGPTGPTGNGISSISKTSTSGLIDTYTITYTNATTSTFTVTNGNGIVSIVKTGTSGLVDTYTITYTNGNTTTFDITNGEDGEVTQTQLDETNAEVERAMMVYNALPKVTDTDTELTLDGTANCPMKLKLNSSELTQETTTGINIFKKINNGTNGTLTITANDDGSYTLNGTPSSSVNFASGGNTLEAGDYTLQCKHIGTLPNNSNAKVQVYSANGSLNMGRTNTSDIEGVTNATLSTNVNDAQFRIRVEGEFNYQNVKLYPLLVKGTYSTSTIPDFEPYTGGIPSPNPEFPSEVQVIKGNNSIKIETKNKLDFDSILNYWNCTYTKNDGVYNLSYFGTAYSTPYTLNLEVGKTYTLSGIISVQSTTNLRLSILKNGSVIGDAYFSGNNVSSTTFTVESGATYTIRADYNGGPQYPMIFSKPQLEKSSTATDYVAPQKQVLPLNLPVENLFDLKSFLTERNVTYTENADGGLTFTTSSALYLNPLQFNEQDIVVSLSGNLTTAESMQNSQIEILNSNNVVIGQINLSSSKVENIVGCKLRFNMTSNKTITLKNVMLEKGDKTNRYTPYGTTPIELCKIGTYEDEFEHDGDKWYLNKYIGKVVLDGSRNWSINPDASTSSGYYEFYAPIKDTGEQVSLICDSFTVGTSYSSTKEQIRNRTDTRFYINILGSRLTTLNAEGFKNWLSNNNVTVYYQLSTPTHEEITDTTLISQLNAIENAVSYDEQTNISQTNTGLPFRIKASAVRSLTNIFDLINE